MKSKNIIILIFSAFLLRFVLSFFGTLSLDFSSFVAWGNRLVDVGPGKFYLAWSDYLPGYLYILWFLAKIKIFIPLFLVTTYYKSPAMLADLVSGYLIYKILTNEKKGKLGFWAAVGYLFNPAVIYNSTLWGQVDSLVSLFSLLVIYFVERNYLLSSIFLAMAACIKPQAGILAFAILVISYKDRWPLKKLVSYSLLSLMVFLFLFFPFWDRSTNFIVFIIQRLFVTFNQYPYTSVNAFSFWGLFGMWLKDSYWSIIGWVMVLTFFIGYTYRLTKKADVFWRWKVMAFLYLASFLFVTRMHERHLLPSLAPLAIVSVVNPGIWLAYMGLSFTYVANLYYSYVWITQNFKTVFSPAFIKILIITNLSLFVYFVKVTLENKKSKLGFDWLKKIVSGEKEVGLKPINLSAGKTRLILCGILLFSFATRLYGLSFPKSEYFDEVYHAFTARLVLHNDPKAWEWWNPNPEGFAYEWTHPPIAKFGMALGMLAVGETPLGWRFPGAILGVGCVYLVYLLSRELFKDEATSLIAALFFSLDGLVLVLSRIGMNDTYMLFFVLFSLYLYLKDKYFFSSLLFGLAISSKWSAIWAVPIFMVFHFVFKKKFKYSYLFYVFLPPLIYLASYSAMFLTGHDFSKFIEVQKQMWWYHTNLKATHAYSSPWWSWPLLARPIWLYTNTNPEGFKSNIYAMGNPAVFWTGFSFVMISFYTAVKERSRKLAAVVFSYLVFFVPWALSPRIMFLYHYLPSIPFMAIASGYILRRFYFKQVVYIFLVALVVFVYSYPHWTGIFVPPKLDTSYYWFSAWR